MPISCFHYILYYSHRILSGSWKIKLSIKTKNYLTKRKTERKERKQSKRKKEKRKTQIRAGERAAVKVMVVAEKPGLVPGTHRATDKLQFTLPSLFGLSRHCTHIYIYTVHTNIHSGKALTHKTKQSSKRKIQIFILRSQVATNIKKFKTSY